MKKGTGFYGDLSPEQEQTLSAFKQELAPMALDAVRYDDYFCLRFLRARKFDLDKSLLMVRNFFQWRADFGTDSILSYSFPEVVEMKNFYPHGYHKTDKQGRPIYIECIGRLELTKLFEVTTEERMMKYYVREYERVLMERFPACSRKEGRHIEQSFTILDLNGISMRMMNKQVYNFVKVASSIAQDYYPEMLGKMFIVNAPTLFSMAWSTIRGFLDEKTRNKITILGSKYQTQLLEDVDVENLPDFLGGNCDCPQGCLNANAGPWNPRGLLVDETGAVIDPQAGRQQPQPLATPEGEERLRGESSIGDIRLEDAEEVERLFILKKAALVLASR